MRESLLSRINAINDFPLGVLLCLTERCALRCPHCYQDRANVRSDDEMTFAEIEMLLDDLASLGVLSLGITGGEPAVRKDLLDIVRAASIRKFAVALKTSASLLDIQDTRKLWEAGLCYLNVSIYHPVASRHDDFVGRNRAFQRVTQALDTFRECGGQVRVSIVAMQWNADSIPFLLDLCEKKGWPFLVQAMVFHKDNGDNAPCNLRANEEQLIKLARDPRLRLPPIPHDMNDSVCMTGRDNPYIRPNGEVWPCALLPISLGNIRVSPIAEIWRTSAIRKRIITNKWADSINCRRCSDASYCLRCMGESFREHGRYDKPSTADCVFAKICARVATENGLDICNKEEPFSSGSSNGVKTRCLID
jgi:MoaA/NifB/PqqE/SkfB family radical SAM enzyme